MWHLEENGRNFYQTACCHIVEVFNLQRKKLFFTKVVKLKDSLCPPGMRPQTDTVDTKISRFSWLQETSSICALRAASWCRDCHNITLSKRREVFACCTDWVLFPSLPWANIRVECRGRVRKIERVALLRAAAVGRTFGLVWMEFSLTLRLLMSYTRCPRRNVKYFGRVFLMLNYTDITQNTYIQSW